jgi:hypothetical protein
MDIRAKVMFVVLLACTRIGIAEAQKESAIPVMEVSDAGAPVRITGHITAKDQLSEVLRYSFEGDVDLTNVSSEPILLMVAKIDVASKLPVSLSYSEEDDYFFESKMLRPGSSAKLQPVLGTFGEPQRSRKSFVAEPSARARIVFVQFLNGSTWGDPVAAERLLRNRRLSLKQLEILKEDYRRQGEEEFQKTLLQPTLLQPIMALQDLYHEKGDLILVLARLDEMLENARTHATPHNEPNSLR